MQIQKKCGCHSHLNGVINQYDTGGLTVPVPNTSQNIMLYAGLAIAGFLLYKSLKK